MERKENLCRYKVGNKNFVTLRAAKEFAAKIEILEITDKHGNIVYLYHPQEEKFLKIN